MPSVPGDGGAWLLPRVIGMSRAAEMMLTGDTINASKAMEWNLVSQVVPPDQLMPRAHDIAHRAKLLAQYPPDQAPDAGIAACTVRHRARTVGCLPSRLSQNPGPYRGGRCIPGKAGAKVQLIDLCFAIWQIGINPDEPCHQTTLHSISELEISRMHCSNHPRKIAIASTVNDFLTISRS
ncbi:MAG: hypothetical protein RLZZ371_1252 [Pseudomonadota bacterium]